MAGWQRCTSRPGLVRLPLLSLPRPPPCPAAGIHIWPGGGGEGGGGKGRGVCLGAAACRACCKQVLCMRLYAMRGSTPRNMHAARRILPAARRAPHSQTPARPPPIRTLSAAIRQLEPDRRRGPRFPACKQQPLSTTFLSASSNPLHPLPPCSCFSCLPDNWNLTGPEGQDFIRQWIQSHMDSALAMGKARARFTRPCMRRCRHLCCCACTAGPGQAAEHPLRSQRFCLPLPAQPLVIEEYGKNVTQQTEAAIEQERNPTFRCGQGWASCRDTLLPSVRASVRLPRLEICTTRQGPAMQSVIPVHSCSNCNPHTCSTHMQAGRISRGWLPAAFRLCTSPSLPSVLLLHLPSSSGCPAGPSKMPWLLASGVSSQRFCNCTTCLYGTTARHPCRTVQGALAASLQAGDVLRGAKVGGWGDCLAAGGAVLALGRQRRRTACAAPARSPACRTQHLLLLLHIVHLLFPSPVFPPSLPGSTGWPTPRSWAPSRLAGTDTHR